jgi:hypothetical protein
VATFAVCGAHPNPLVFEDTADSLIKAAKTITSNLFSRSACNVLTISTDEPQPLPLKAINPPADAPIEILLHTAVDPPALSLTKAEIPSP